MLTIKIRQKGRGMNDQLKIENRELIFALRVSKLTSLSQENVQNSCFFIVRNFQFSTINFQFLNDGDDAALLKNLLMRFLFLQELPVIPAS